MLSFICQLRRLSFDPPSIFSNKFAIPIHQVSFSSHLKWSLKVDYHSWKSIEIEKFYWFNNCKLIWNEFDSLRLTEMNHSWFQQIVAMFVGMNLFNVIEFISKRRKAEDSQ
jgi:hypothetical protein